MRIYNLIFKVWKDERKKFISLVNFIFRKNKLAENGGRLFWDKSQESFCFSQNKIKFEVGLKIPDRKW